jgi:hypothetical protein
MIELPSDCLLIDFTASFRRTRASLYPYMKLRQNGTVSFSIKLAAFQASGWAEPGTDPFRVQ